MLVECTYGVGNHNSFKIVQLTKFNSTEDGRQHRYLDRTAFVFIQQTRQVGEVICDISANPHSRAFCPIQPTRVFANVFSVLFAREKIGGGPGE
jgi:hypothetical protein